MELSAQIFRTVKLLNCILADEYVNGQWKLWSEWVGVQTDLGLCCQYAHRHLFLGTACIILDLQISHQLFLGGAIFLNLCQKRSLEAVNAATKTLKILLGTK